MPIILKHGKFYKNPPEFWWVGRKMKCEKCGCEFELTYQDKPVYLGNLNTPSPQFRISCPECGSVETVEQKKVEKSSGRSDDTHMPWQEGA